MKQKKIRKCRCGKKIIGFSENHAKANLQIHLNSKEHKLRIDVIKSLIIKAKDKNKIRELLLSSPIILNDLKEIGRNYEKKILVP